MSFIMLLLMAGLFFGAIPYEVGKAIDKRQGFIGGDKFLIWTQGFVACWFVGVIFFALWLAWAATQF